MPLAPAPIVPHAAPAMPNSGTANEPKSQPKISRALRGILNKVINKLTSMIIPVFARPLQKVESAAVVNGTNPNQESRL